jgi:hypothetical protein
MTPPSLQTFDRHMRHRHEIDHVVWEPQLPRRPFRRPPWEQAKIVEVTAGGARIRAHTNRAIRGGTRVSIAFGADRGLVVVRQIDRAPDRGMAYYGVQFLWLDSALEARFADDLISLR